LILKAKFVVLPLHVTLSELRHRLQGDNKGNIGRQVDRYIDKRTDTHIYICFPIYSAIKFKIDR